MRENIIRDIEETIIMGDSEETRMAQRRAKLLDQFHPQQKPQEPVVQATKLSQLRPELRKTVDDQVRKAGEVFSTAMRLLTETKPGVKAVMGEQESELYRFQQMAQAGKTEDLFKNCKVQYGYNQRQKIYSIQVDLDNRPRIITIRAGENFTEVSLADQKGKVLEMLRQEGRSISFSKMD